MNNLDVDVAIEYVNKIVENIRCTTCDKLEEDRVRYPCGHTACNDCVTYTESCLTCTPPNTEIFARPDYPWTQTVKNATALFKAGRKLLDTNAYERKRTSKLLKIEKEVFPECIQAPAKYENKRKTARLSLNNKENRNSTIFPGEVVLPAKDSKMEKSFTYVQQWLSKNEKSFDRKPFSDLNINAQRINNTKHIGNIQIFENNKFSVQKNRKELSSKTGNKFKTGVKNKLVYETNLEVKKRKLEETNIIKNEQNLCDNDESGIFMENEPIVIDDSQEVVIDKDKLAWLAVLEEHKNGIQSSTSLSNLSNINQTVDHSKHMLNTCTYNVKTNNKMKVPFFKKSAIYETCNYCRNDINITDKDIPDTVSSGNKPVTITIDSDAFVTTVTVVRDVPFKNNNTKKTISTQTDIHIDLNKNHITEKTIHSNLCNDSRNFENDFANNKPINEGDKKSVDLFADERNGFEKLNKKAETNKCVIIEESDSDSDIETSQHMCVQADVHKSCDEMDYGILTDILNIKQHEVKARRRPRGHTPTSTDSSEKENYNPNRMRKSTYSKKKRAKK